MADRISFISKAGERDIDFEVFGDPANPPLVLILTIGGNTTLWSDELCELLLQAGYYLICFNFGSGTTDWGTDENLPPPRPLPRLLSRIFCCCCFLTCLCGKKQSCCMRTPYNMDDMADSVITMLDSLRIREAHFVGGSLGGIVAQCVAIRYTPRVLSLALISTCGSFLNPSAALREAIYQPSTVWEVADRSLEDGVSDDVREALVNEQVSVYQTLAYTGGNRSSTALGTGDAQREYFMQREATRLRFRTCARKELDMAQRKGVFDISGRRKACQQFSAMLATRDRYHDLRTALRGGTALPTLIIHGRMDPLIPIRDGELLRDALPQAIFRAIGNMGHELAPRHYGKVIAMIAQNSKRRVSGSKSVDAQSCRTSFGSSFSSDHRQSLDLDGGGASSVQELAMSNRGFSSSMSAHDDADF